MWFHEFSVTKNLRIFQETEFVYYSYALLMKITTFIFVEKDIRFVISEFVKLSGEFDTGDGIFPLFFFRCQRG